MAKEIERKFLVDMALLKTLPQGKRIVQGYVPTQDLTVVRVRIMADQAFLTLKGANQGMTRTEFEYAVPVEDAEQMLEQFCQGQMIDKVRYCIQFGQHIWELDVFGGANQGVVVAEVELQSETEEPDLPEWVTTEVTGDPRYYNSALMEHPFSEW
ncbi:CYTH domain-containing protein [Pleionea sp. CnH1-48]|uniref:CYTH domain-containing protein n=1 Tax=Pleionea sp. CnH1-48 TaxID=2954494 RepID=UPI002096DBAB|nr:CYTH domain-containing protein [Pleionea sp. CnH1-48]MCO7225894.1 CYTH domain-containing protein [Pleionea sp. CnH1-48]